MTKKEREEREYISHFTDERYAKRAWKSLIGSSLESSGKCLPDIIDPKTGELSFQSQIDKMAYENVKARLESEGKSREPMQAELIIECSILRARFTDTTLNTILDRTAGKVKEEIAVSTSPFEELTDEELELLAKYRDSKESNVSKEQEENKNE